MRHKHALHFAQVGHLGEGLRQLDHCAHVLATVGQVVAGKAATRVHAAAINQENGGYPLSHPEHACTWYVHVGAD